MTGPSFGLERPGASARLTDEVRGGLSLGMGMVCWGPALLPRATKYVNPERCPDGWGRARQCRTNQ